MRSHIATILGIAGPGSGIIFSLTNAEIGLRLLSLVIGIAVGLFSLRLIKVRTRNHERNNALQNEMAVEQGAIKTAMARKKMEVLDARRRRIEALTPKP